MIRLNTIDHSRLVTLRAAVARGEDFLLQCLRAPPPHHFPADVNAAVNRHLKTSIREWQSRARAIKMVFHREFERVGRIPSIPAELSPLVSQIDFLCDPGDCPADLFDRSCASFDRPPQECPA